MGFNSGFKGLTVILMEQCTLTLLVNRVLRKICGCGRKKASGGRGQMQEVLSEFYPAKLLG